MYAEYLVENSSATQALPCVPCIFGCPKIVFRTFKSVNGSEKNIPEIP